MRLALAFLLFAAPLVAQPVESDGLVAPRSAAARLLIPAAGAVEGANGTFFRSDIRIANLGSEPALVEMIWLPREGWATPPRLDPGAGTLVREMIEPGAILHSDDFVTEVLRTSGLGAILVQAVRGSSATIDETARLQATSRIWSPAGEGGTGSQSFPSVALLDIVSEHVAILGHRRDEDYRTNVGLVNLDDTSFWTFRITVSGENPTLVPEVYEVSVPPYGVAQFPIQGVQQTKMRIDVEVLSAPGGGILSLWQAFASTVDNRTGDAWSTLAFELP